MWDYFVASFAPLADWAALTFDPEDEGWSQGPTGIGYDDGDDATVVDMMNAYSTVYARRTFQLQLDPESLAYLRLRVRYDDGRTHEKGRRGRP